MSIIELHAVGIIHTPFKTIKGMPIQPPGARGAEGWVEVFPPYIAGLQDLAGFSHIILLYHFHKVERVDLVVTPFLDSQPRGVFATRAPTRPNPIGLSIVELHSVDQDQLKIANVDILDGTPLLDIKPFIPAFDIYGEVKTGWFSDSKEAIENKLSDDRFRSGS